MTKFKPVAYNSYGREFLNPRELPIAPRYFFRSSSGPYFGSSFGLDIRSTIEWKEWFVRCGSNRVFNVKRYSGGDKKFIVEGFRFEGLDEAIQFGLSWQYAEANGYLILSATTLLLMDMDEKDKNK